jgi:hypothetical protein
MLRKITILLFVRCDVWAAACLSLLCRIILSTILLVLVFLRKLSVPQLIKVNAAEESGGPQTSFWCSRAPASPSFQKQMNDGHAFPDLAVHDARSLMLFLVFAAFVFASFSQGHRLMVRPSVRFLTICHLRPLFGNAG